MFGSLGFPEIIFILVLALLVFGPKKLPEVGRTIGGALREFRRATGDLKRTFDQEVNIDPMTSTPEPDIQPAPEPAAESESEPDEPGEMSAEAPSEEDLPS